MLGIIHLELLYIELCSFGKPGYVELSKGRRVRRRDFRPISTHFDQQEEMMAPHKPAKFVSYEDKDKGPLEC